VKVTARRFARAVWLSTPDGDGAFSDNFFDLLPGETATVEWTPAPGARPGGAERLSSMLHATTVRDTY
jgi:beta-mannosidase